MKMVITLHTYQLVLPCLLGVEGLVAEELRDMGAENVAPENGRVLCAGSPEMIARGEYPLPLCGACARSARYI